MATKAQKALLNEVKDLLKMANVKPGIAKLDNKGFVSLAGLVVIEDNSIEEEDIFFVYYYAGDYEDQPMQSIPSNEFENEAGYYDRLEYAVIAALQFYVKAEIINELNTRWADEAERRDEHLAERRGR